jgi:sarcosine oxidase gamma subunit
MTKSDFSTIADATARKNCRIVSYRNIKPLIVDAIQVNAPTGVPTSAGVLHAGPGDWLIRDPHGNVKLCDNTYFTSNYAPLKDSRPLEQFRERKFHGGC